MNICLVRHGESTLNQQQIITGSLDAPLTPRGEEQAREIGRRLLEETRKEQPLGPLWDDVYCSTLKRARETFNLMQNEVFKKEYSYDNVRVPYYVKELVERSYGKEEGTPYTKGAYTPDMFLKQPKDGETLQQLAERICRFINVHLCGKSPYRNILF
jgi:broad specificity phosphatase PhoE